MPSEEVLQECLALRGICPEHKSRRTGSEVSGICHQMERDGEVLSGTGRALQGTHLAQVFRMLARDEQEHARILERHKVS